MKYKKLLYVLLAISLILYWLVGWTSIDIVINPDYGKKITFSESMVLAKFGSNEYGDINLISNYVLFSKAEWLHVYDYISAAKVVDVDVCEEFTVLNKYIIKRHGFLTPAFQGDINVITVKSSDGIVAAEIEEMFEYFSKDKDSVSGNATCLHN